MELQKMLDGSLLTTAEVLYFMPDYPDLLQLFLWQEYDKPPEFPRMNQFLAYWVRCIEARMHSLTIFTSDPLVVPDAKMVAYYSRLQ